MTNRKPLIGRSGGSGRLSARDRRDAQSSAQGETFLFPLRVDERGRVGVELSGTGPLYVDPARGLSFRVAADSGLEVSSASPFALRLRPGGNVRYDEAKQALVAEPTTDEVKGSDGVAVSDALVRERNARVAADEALSARVAVFETARGETTLSGGTKAITITGIPSTALVFLQVKTASSLGTLTYAITTDTLTINSTSGSDASTVNYLVVSA